MGLLLSSPRLLFVVRGLRVPATSVAFIVIGCAILDSRYLAWPIGTGCAVLGLIAITLYQLSAIESARKANDVRERRYVYTEEEAHLVQDLLSPYPPYVEAAAQQLGAIKDAAGVPSLINVLDRCAWRSEPGWESVCLAIVRALAEIRDGRALPVLYRVRGARGNEFTDEVDAAVKFISRLEQTGNVYDL